MLVRTGTVLVPIQYKRNLFGISQGTVWKHSCQAWLSGHSLSLVGEGFLWPHSWLFITGYSSFAVQRLCVCEPNQTRAIAKKVDHGRDFISCPPTGHGHIVVYHTEHHGNSFSGCSLGRSRAVCKPTSCQLRTGCSPSLLNLSDQGRFVSSRWACAVLKCRHF